MKPARLRHFHLVRFVCIVLGLLCFAKIGYGQDRWYRASVITAVCAQGADIASSWGGIEANPVLGAGQRYGYRATSIKLAVFGGGQAAQYAAIKAHPRWMRVATVVNFAFAAATARVAINNWRIRR